MRRMAQEGCRIEQAASAIGIRVDSAGRLAAKLGLSRQFHENRLPKVCREGHAYERDARGRRVCRACIQKANITQRQRRYREGLPVGDLRHGTSNGYRNWGCRCDQCKAAGAVDNKQTRERRKEAAR